MKVIEQAVRDYCSLEWTNIPYKLFHWQTAHDFLFDDNYFIPWGDTELNLEIISSPVGVDVGWVRLRAKRRYQKEKENRAAKMKAEDERQSRQSKRSH